MRSPDLCEREAGVPAAMPTIGNSAPAWITPGLAPDWCTAPSTINHDGQHENQEE
jgi:hypothetical protein